MAYTSLKVPTSVCQQISTTTSITFTDDLGRYLGVPLIQWQITKQMYMYNIDRIQHRLTSWKVHNLLLAGRCTLIQYIIAGIPLTLCK